MKPALKFTVLPLFNLPQLWSIKDPELRPPVPKLGFTAGGSHGKLLLRCSASKAVELSGLRVILERVSECVRACVYKHAWAHPCLWISDVNRGFLPGSSSDVIRLDDFSH